MLAALLLATAVPPAAIADLPPDVALVARGERASEPVRGVVEYLGALAAFTLANVGGSALLSDARVRVGHGTWSVDNGGAVAGAGACFVLSPLAAALTSYFIGKGSDAYDPSLGWSTLGAYGTSAVALVAGLGLAAVNVDRSAAVAADTVLYLAVPLGSVLLQNATKEPRQ
ncbi:MAG TPA: hypothetical protein VLW85_25330 [Myxococcales bacterium]|nr:hypothetical protein [Myxococcales bacterium]